MLFTRMMFTRMLLQRITLARITAVRMVPLFIGMIAILTANVAQAEIRVNLELYTSPGFTAVDAQKWYQLFTSLKVRGLQIKSGSATTTPKITKQGTSSNPTYLVQGVLTTRGELMIPGKRFKLQDRIGISQWLTELSTWGPQGAPEGKAVFGLNTQQFQQVKGDLARVVLSSTKNRTRGEVIREISGRLETPFIITSTESALLGKADDKVIQELKGLSTGTAIACLLRPQGLTFRPHRQPDDTFQYQVSKGADGEQFWPVGWKPEKKNSEVLPALMEFINVEIEPTPLVEVVGILKDHLKVPVLVDINSLVKHDVDLTQKVSFPKKRSYYDRILRTLLAQAKLKRELRVDDADKPFIWVSSMKDL